MSKRKRGSGQGNESFRARLREAVNNAGGCYKFSKLAKVSMSSVNNYLRGGEPTRPVLTNLAKAANVSIDYLTTGSPSLYDKEMLVPARMVLACGGAKWERGPTFAYFHRDLVKERFRGGSPDDLLLVPVGDPYMQPRIWQDEVVITDGTRNTPQNGIFALMIDGELLIRHIAKSRSGFVVHDRRKRRGEQSFSFSEFQQEVSVVGKALISGHYPEITEDNTD